MRRTTLPALLATALIAAGCGSGGSGGSGGAVGGDTSRGKDSSSTQAGANGKALFAGKCGSCHMLAAAGTSGSFGPDLDELKPDKASVLAAIESGPGPMPGNLYEGAEAEAVAQFVSASAGK
jgi:mono/diheme cytochrome c family protein